MTEAQFSSEYAPDPDDLRARLAAIGGDAVRISGLSGGEASYTYRADLGGGATAVLKVAPRGLEPKLNRDVLRQARILRALSDVDGVPVPRVLFEDPGTPPETPPFFGMSVAEGEAYEPVYEPREHLLPAEVVAGRQRSAAQALARLHGVGIEGVGLTDEPIGAPVDEVVRWHRTLVRSAPEVEDAANRLRDELVAMAPEPVPPVIVHGDYRLGNVLCSGSEVTAILDWEIWSLGDPRVDLAWMRVYCWPTDHPLFVHNVPGLYSPEQICDDYADARHEGASDARLDALAWFDAMVRFKLAGICTYNGRRQRRESAPTKDWYRVGLDLLDRVDERVSTMERSAKDGAT